MRELDRLEERVPRARHRRQPHPAGGRRTHRAVRAGGAPARPCSRWTTPSRWEELEAWGKRVERQVGQAGRLRLRAEDRRPGRGADVRGRRRRAWAPPAATAARRGHHRQHAHDPARPHAACATGQPPKLLEVRGEVYLPVSAFEKLNEELRDRGPGVLRQPAQRRRGQPPAEGPGRSRPPGRCRLWSHGLGAVEGKRFERHSESWSTCRTAGLPVNPQTERVDSLEEVFAFCERWQTRPPLDRLRDRRRGGEGRPDRRCRKSWGRPARLLDGPSPTSSRPRSGPRCSARSTSTPGGPASSRPSPCSSRCSSAASRSPRRPCTTRTRSSARTSARGTR